MAALVLRGLSLAAIYLLLVGQLSVDEIGLALACGSIVLGWSLALDRVAQRDFSFSPGALAIVARAAGKVPQAIIAVAPALLWRRRGSIGREPLRHGGNGSGDAGWRAAALLAISLAPDQYALRWSKQGDVVETHRLSIKPAPGEQV